MSQETNQLIDMLYTANMDVRRLTDENTRLAQRLTAAQSDLQYAQNLVNTGELAKYIATTASGLIDAIKAYRRITGYGLKVSKEAIEEFWVG